VFSEAGERTIAAKMKLMAEKFLAIHSMAAKVWETKAFFCERGD